MRVDYHRIQMRFTLGVVITLLIAAAIVACSGGNDSTPASTIVSTSAPSPTATECANDHSDCRTPTAESVPPPPAVLATPTVAVLPLATACANGKTECDDSDSDESESDDMDRSTDDSPATEIATPSPTVQPTPTIAVEPVATACVNGKSECDDSDESDSDDVDRGGDELPAAETATPSPTVQPTTTLSVQPSPTTAVEPVATRCASEKTDCDNSESVESKPDDADSGNGDTAPIETATSFPTVRPIPTPTFQPTPFPTVEPTTTIQLEPTATQCPNGETECDDSDPVEVEPGDATSLPVEGELEPPGEITWVDNPDCESVSKSPLSTIPVKLSWRDVEQIVSSEVAASSAQRSQGLMCRGDVPHGSGMLFLFDQPRSGGFWMFNTYVPLDILYIDGSGAVIWHDTMEPCIRQMNESESAWRSRCSDNTSRPDTSLGGYKAALELPSGWLDHVGIDPDLPEELIVTWQ